MRYYPLNRVKTNQKTTGGQYVLNGADYKGYYYETYDGTTYTGKDPIQGPSQKLQKLETTDPRLNTNEYRPTRGNTILTGPDIDGYVESRGSLYQPQTFQVPQPYYPSPTDDDYARRSFTRYFAKKRSQAGFVIEIDQTTYDALKAADEKYDYINYECISTLWQLTGPLRDDRTNKQYKIAGIIDTNERLINAKEPTFLGLKAFIGGEYAKFAKPTK